MTALYRHQHDAMIPILAGKPVYLGFDPGLGKSRTALEAAKARAVSRLLIIAPASGRYVWERECKLWWPEMPFTIVRGPADLLASARYDGIYLVTYGLLSQKGSPAAAAIAANQAFEMTVLDEATAVKNSGANRTRAILGKMLPKLGYLLPMSGTPAPNHAGELYPILRANYPKAIAHGTAGRQMTETEFQDAFCKVESKPFGPGRQGVRVITGSKNIPALRERMNGYMLRVRKEDVLADLPPIRWDVVPVRPSSDGFAALPSAPTGLSDDELLQWLSGGDDHVMRIRRMLGIAKLTGSIEYIDEFLQNLAQDRKVLVFAHHREVINQLVTGLGGWKPSVVVGETVPAARTKAIDQFLTDPMCRVFIGNIQAAGTALTLVGPHCKCADVFFVEATYSPSDNYQAACRVHRIGQNDGVVARFLSAHGTIDDRIQEILARKASDFDQLFN